MYKRDNINIISNIKSLIFFNYILKYDVYKLKKKDLS